MFKTESEITEAANKVDTDETNYPAMSYENGVEEALMWVLGEVSDEEFEYGAK